MVQSGRYINWENSRTEVFINPKLNQDQLILPKKLPNLSHHIWITSSGTFQLKYIALSKSAFLSSASAVNTFLKSNCSDIWLHALPDFHVGGLAIWARAYLSHAKVVVQKKWNPFDFVKLAEEESATLTSLVPTQLYDLVKHGLKAPISLRAVIIGGGGISEVLRNRAVQLSWPILPSYGLTECSSQVATAKDHKSPLIPLPHIQYRIDENDYLFIKSSSLLSGYAMIDEKNVSWSDPKIEGWFKTEDKVKIIKGGLEVIGRDSSFVKISGESVNLHRLNHILESVRIEVEVESDMAVIAVPDQRLGHSVRLMTSSFKNIEKVIKKFAEKVPPFERIRSVHVMRELPRNAMGKISLT
ncbi:MAG: hypothetical protein Tsb0021_05060 [Chlamydiales bacterium]